MDKKYIEWKPPIAKWYNVKKEAYEFIYNQAKDRFEDILSESESITNKSIKMIVALAGFLGFFVGYVKDKSLDIPYYKYGFALFIIVDAILLFILISPKEIKNRGLIPSKSIPKNLDADEDKDYQTELVYYQGIIIMQDNCDFMINKNKCRATFYQWALGLFLLVFAAILALFVHFL